MPDILTPEQRSRNMSRVRSRDTKPEMQVRRLVYAMGYRYRLHRRDLPGRPDLVFPGRRKVIFVHGCFWHQHDGCRKASLPQTRREFWAHKLTMNRKRDESNLELLHALGWAVLVVWECETRTTEALAQCLSDFLSV